MALPRAQSWIVALIAAAAGCGSAPSGPLAELPTHRLLPDPPPQAPPTQPDAGRAAFVAEPGWAVEGTRPWRHIVIHHSATDRGSAAIFDRAHREQRGWDELGYHFVIDNGNGGPDGRVEVGSRWRKQKWGAHCGGTPGNEYNNHGIGICLVGDFTAAAPTPAQLASLSRLVAYLAARYDIPPERVIGHCDAPAAATACPGTVLHDYIRRTLRPALARRLAAAE